MKITKVNRFLRPEYGGFGSLSRFKPMRASPVTANAATTPDAPGGYWLHQGSGRGFCWGRPAAGRKIICGYVPPRPAEYRRRCLKGHRRYRYRALDIKAKALGVPLYELFGGPYRDSIKLYWGHCGLYRALVADRMQIPPLIK